MRKKEILVLILLVIAFNCIGQNYAPLTVIAKGFTIMNSHNSKEIKSKKTIILTYNSENSFLHIEGEGSHSFGNERYSQEPYIDGGFVEFFMSAETETSMAGFWIIHVFKMKDRTDLEISFRNGITYYAKNVKLYSEDGQIMHNAYIKDYKGVEKNEYKPTQSQTNSEIVVTDPIYTTVEQMPTFPGGDVALLQYISKNLKYPAIAQENGIQGKVIVRIVVTKTGDVGSVEVLKGIDPACDKEAVRLVKTLPKFVPGKQNGVDVSVYYMIQVTFSLRN